MPADKPIAELLEELRKLVPLATPEPETGHSQTCGCDACRRSWNKGRDLSYWRGEVVNRVPALLDHIDTLTAQVDNALFERWNRYLQVAQKANFHGRNLADLTLPDPDRFPGLRTIAIPRDRLIEWRSDYMTLLVLASDLLGVPPQELTYGQAFFAMMQRHMQTREGDDDDG